MRSLIAWGRMSSAKRICATSGAGDSKAVTASIGIISSTISSSASSTPSEGSPISCTTAISSAIRATISSSATLALLISIFQPLSFAASRTFCPSLPMASDNCPSGTTTTAAASAGFVSTRNICAGLSALAMNILGSGCHRTTSTFSPCSSLIMF
ncbi:MAG: hypothetical protein DDT28_00046 [Dehalococcoidia bacterium]|nr:hypothetical protein [Chloroflexota bacterium]